MVKTEEPVSTELRLRPTSLVSFQACPARWAAEHPDLALLPPAGVQVSSRKLDPERDYAAWGTAVHAIVEQVLLHKLDLHYDEQEWQRAWLSAKPSKMPQGEWDNAKEYAARLNHWLADLVANHGYVLQALEQRLEEPLPGVEGVTISGQPDAVYWSEKERSFVVVDHKTNRTYESRSVWEQRLQPRAYAWLLRQQWRRFNSKKRRLPSVYFVLGYAVLPQPIMHAGPLTVEWNIAADDHLRTEEAMRDLARQVKWARDSGEWPERVNDYCGSCPLKADCRTLERTATETLAFATGEQVDARSRLEQYVQVGHLIKGLQGVQEEIKLEMLDRLQASSNFIQGRPSFRDGDLEAVLRETKTRRILGERFLARIRALEGKDNARFQEVANDLITVNVGALERENRAGHLQSLAHLIEEAEVVVGKPSLRVQSCKQGRVLPLATDELA